MGDLTQGLDPGPQGVEGIPGIERLATLRRQYTLAVSLHAAQTFHAGGPREGKGTATILGGSRWQEGF